MARVEDVAKYILHEMGGMPAMKLQKLCYYSQAWHLVWDAEPLFEARIEAWANGPVVRELYAKHRLMWEVQESDLVGDLEALTTDERETVDAVLQGYGDMTARELSNLTHSEPPWLDARAGMQDGQRGNVEISTVSMREYYDSQYRPA